MSVTGRTTPRRLLIVDTHVPFSRGTDGTTPERSCALERELRAQGHAVERLMVPTAPLEAEELSLHVLALRLLQPPPRVDLAICLDFPGYLLRHPGRVLWGPPPKRADGGAERALATRALSSAGDDHGPILGTSPQDVAGWAELGLVAEELCPAGDPEDWDRVIARLLG